MRRPSIRSLAGGAAGIASGVIAGVVLTAVSAAGPPAVPKLPALIDAAHVPRLLRLPGEPVRLRYSIVCAPRDDGLPCDGSGTVYIRDGGGGQFRPLALRRGDDSKEGRYYIDVPPELASSAAGFSYYAVLRDDSSGATVTVPSGGADAPQLSLLLSPRRVGVPRRKTSASPARGSWVTAARRPSTSSRTARWICSTR